MVTNVDPWKNIESPTASDAFKAHRVDKNGTWDFWWAVGIDRHRYLLLTHSSDATPSIVLPKMKGIETALAIDSGNEAKSTLSFKLVDTAQSDIFHRLCLDIISSCGNAKTEKESVSIAISRAWRWHHLLRGGRDGLLSPEEQKGLIGELRILESFLIPLFASAAALQAWGGPTGTPIDFEINRIGIESKARRGGSARFVSISSEFQLDDDGLDALFLNVAEVDRAEKEAVGSFTLTTAVENVRAQLSDDALIDFEGKLSAVGFSWGDSYDDYWWIEGASHIYAVVDEFPKIAPDSITSGVSGVRYSISLPDCKPFLTSIDSVTEMLRSSIHAN